MGKDILELSGAELKQARLELAEAVRKLDWREVAKIIGDPIDPRKPSPSAEIIGKVCDIEPATSPDEYLFYFECDEDTKYVYALASAGTVTKVDVSLNTPTAITFTGIQSPVYKVHIVDLNNAKFDVIGKKKRAITNALDNRELHDVLSLLWEGTPDANRFTLDSGDTYLNFPKLLELVKAVKKYGDKLYLICGADVDTDLTVTDYNENKNQSVISMIEKLGIEKIEVTGVYMATMEHNIFESDRALLVATSTVVGKPASFGRKQLVPGVVIDGQVDAKLRYLSVVPVIPRNAEAPSVGMWGYGEIQAVLKNPKAVARFSDEEHSA